MSASTWLIRLLLTVLLALGSEIVLWSNPIGRPVQDWPLLLAAYLALGAVLLDLLVRYRARDLFGILPLAGVYGLMWSLLLNPQAALVEMPRTLLTRVMGAHALLGLAMIGLFLALARVTGHRSLLAVGALCGLAWGIWVRWLPLFSDLAGSAVALATMLACGAAALAALLVVWAAARRWSNGMEPARLLLPLWQRLLLMLLAALLLTIRLNAGLVDPLPAVIIVVLVAYCWLLLWFQKREKGRWLLDQPLRLLPIIPTGLLGTLLFLGAGALGYNLPFDARGEQLAVLIGAFTAFGLVWLPTVSLVIGVRAYRKLTRQQRL